MKNLIIVGSGGYAGVVIDAVLQSESHKIIGLVDDFLSEGQIEKGFPILGGISSLEKWRHEDIFFAIGNCRDRFEAWKRLNSYCPKFTTIIHPRASVSASAMISSGVFVGAGASIGNNCQVGMMSIVNTNATLCHDAILGEFSHLAPNSSVGGAAKVGNICTVGMGGVIADRVIVGSGITVEIGGKVVDNIH